MGLDNFCSTNIIFGYDLSLEKVVGDIIVPSNYFVLHQGDFFYFNSNTSIADCELSIQKGPQVVESDLYDLFSDKRIDFAAPENFGSNYLPKILPITLIIPATQLNIENVKSKNSKINNYVRYRFRYL